MKYILTYSIASLLLAGCVDQEAAIQRNFAGWIPPGADVEVMRYDPDFAIYAVAYSDPRSAEEIAGESRTKLSHGHTIDVETSDTIGGSRKTERGTEHTYFGFGRPGRVLFLHANIDSAAEQANLTEYLSEDFKNANQPE